MTSEFLIRFEDELQRHPDRAGGEELHERMTVLARQAARLDSTALAGVLSAWLSQRAEPRTMIAVTIIRELRLVAFRQELQELLDDIRARRCFLPFYERPVSQALDALL